MKKSKVKKVNEFLWVLMESYSGWNQITVNFNKIISYSSSIKDYFNKKVKIKKSYNCKEHWIS